MLKRIGKVAYRLKLHVDSKIHHVLYISQISQLKPVLGIHHEVKKLPKNLHQNDEVVVDIENYKIAVDICHLS